MTVADISVWRDDHTGLMGDELVRDVLCIHRDDDVRSRLAAGAAESFSFEPVTTLDEGAARHGHSPFDVVIVELDPDAAVVRAVLAWHPVPAIITVGDELDEAVERALASGAHDHLPPDAADREVALAIDRSWRRHRAARTKRATRDPATDMQDVRQRVSQLVSLTAAAKELLGIDEPPHTTVRSLLEQAGEIGQETVHLAGQTSATEVRTLLDLEGIARTAWDAHDPQFADLDLTVQDVEVHGYPGMLRTALVVLFAYCSRGPATTVLLDIEIVPGAVRLRVHDDGPAIGVSERRMLFVGDLDTANPMLMTVEHVAARHGGTAWLADSDRIDGTMAVIELPRRVVSR